MNISDRLSVMLGTVLWSLTALAVWFAAAAVTGLFIGVAARVYRMVA